ncbi:MAG TPA: NUDIX domain-containing protein [Acholeplasma sp.]|jgi:ADP-ribose pyrophosphatase YjhB (NUDIX family)|nr:NUDIX domain-containing protein [Acholeplasma sp.]
MKKISDMIIEEGLENQEIHKKRVTVRGVIQQGNKVLMVYSPLFKDYTFPGGGVKDNETLEDALKRELEEELGAKKVYNISPIGFVEEKRYGVSGSNHVYHQTSFYFTCKIDQLGEQKLESREYEHGVIPTWVEIKEAILVNEKTIKEAPRNKGMKTVLPRENAVLKYLLRGLEDEKI